MVSNTEIIKKMIEDINEQIKGYRQSYPNVTFYQSFDEVYESEVVNEIGLDEEESSPTQTFRLWMKVRELANERMALEQLLRVCKLEAENIDKIVDEKVGAIIRQNHELREIVSAQRITIKDLVEGDKPSYEKL